MNIDTVKINVSKHLGIVHNFVYKGSRGQDEKFCGKINNLYPRVFTIITDKGLTKAFSYSDFAINNLKIC